MSRQEAQEQKSQVFWAFPKLEDVLAATFLSRLAIPDERDHLRTSFFIPKSPEIVVDNNRVLSICQSDLYRDGNVSAAADHMAKLTRLPSCPAALPEAIRSQHSQHIVTNSVTAGSTEWQPERRIDTNQPASLPSKVPIVSRSSACMRYATSILE
jgi:hypothetical protein